MCQYCCKAQSLALFELIGPQRHDVMTFGTTSRRAAIWLKTGHWECTWNRSVAHTAVAVWYGERSNHPTKGAGSGSGRTCCRISTVTHGHLTRQQSAIRGTTQLLMSTKVAFTNCHASRLLDQRAAALMTHPAYLPKDSIVFLTACPGRGKIALRAPCT